MESPVRPSPPALAVLSLLAIGPLHPYGMQRLIKLFGKGKVVNVGQRANLYKTIKRLHDAGLIAVRQTERDQQYPERTVYELTAQGRTVGPEWLADMLATPLNEFPRFPAALSFAMLLGPDAVLTALQQRAALVRTSLTAVEAELAEVAATLPRITLLDDEYQRVTLTAELTWLDGVIADLRAGRLTWSDEIAEQAKGFLTE